MRKPLLIISLTALMLFLYSVSMADEQDSVVNANNEFAFKLYSKYKTQDGNIFYSPYSISSVMAMIFEGARGKTAEEIQSVFHFPDDLSVLRESSKKINQKLNKKDKTYQISLVNALWVQNDFLVLNDYLSLAKKYYHGKITNLDFINQTEQSRSTINNWVKNQTNHKIIDLIPQGGITEVTRFVLTNAIYFKGLWLTPFDKEYTRENEFRSLNGIIKTEMMCLDGNFSYTESDNVQILEMPYKMNNISMFILLPNNDDLASLEKSLGKENLNKWKRQLNKEYVRVELPKFELDTQYFIKNDLEEMGMPSAFIEGADFSGITGNHSLKIDAVIHKAFIGVNEEGTEAAAATSVGFSITAAPPVPQIIFKADHPFVFIIQDKDNENILFMGRLTIPEIKK